MSYGVEGHQNIDVVTQVFYGVGLSRRKDEAVRLPSGNFYIPDFSIITNTHKRRSHYCNGFLALFMIMVPSYNSRPADDNMDVLLIRYGMRFKNRFCTYLATKKQRYPTVSHSFHIENIIQVENGQ